MVMTMDKLYAHRFYYPLCNTKEIDGQKENRKLLEIYCRIINIILTAVTVFLHKVSIYSVYIVYKLKVQFAIYYSINGNKT